MSERTIRSSKIRIGDISVSYYINTSQQEDHTIIFLHGFPFNKNTWRPQLENLPDNTTGIALDIRGHGNTTKGHGFFSIDVFAKDLGLFIKKLELRNVLLCGVSMGGYIALRAMELYPQSIKGLILSDTHSKSDNDEQKQKRFDSIQAILNHGRRPFAIGFVENLFAKQTIENNSTAVDLIKSSIRRNSVTTICATLLALAARTDTSQGLQNIDVPTLLIRGKEDKITPDELMSEMKKKIKNAEFVSLENCGHLPNLEVPQQFNELLLKFMERIKAKS